MDAIARRFAKLLIAQIYGSEIEDQRPTRAEIQKAAEKAERRKKKLSFPVRAYKARQGEWQNIKILRLAKGEWLIWPKNGMAWRAEQKNGCWFLRPPNTGPDREKLMPSLLACVRHVAQVRPIVPAPPEPLHISEIRRLEALGIV